MARIPPQLLSEHTAALHIGMREQVFGAGLLALITADQGEAASAFFQEHRAVLSSPAQWPLWLRLVFVQMNR